MSISAEATARTEVFVVDGVAETEEVLRAILEPRGYTISRAADIAAAKVVDRPDSVVVRHADRRKFDGNGPCVVVGRLEDPDDQQYLPQPYNYADLIAAIEAKAARRSAA